MSLLEGIKNSVLLSVVEGYEKELWEVKKDRQHNLNWAEYLYADKVELQKQLKEAQQQQPKKEE